MAAAARQSIAITGMGAICSLGKGVESFRSALSQGRGGVVRRPAAQPMEELRVKVAATVSARDREQALEERLAASRLSLGRMLRGASASLSLSIVAALEAWDDAGLAFPLPPALAERTGLIVAGSNLHHDLIATNRERFHREGRRSPRYALTFFDTHQIGVISELLGIRGPGISVGAASASGNAAIFNAAQWLRTGAVDRVLVVGASPGFSTLELEAFALLGAASESDDPATASAPFDVSRSGFVWGEGSGALLLETAQAATARQARRRGGLLGVSLRLDAHHLPDPSREGEVAAMQAALEDAGLAPTEIGYLNAHGTGSPLGDETECAAIRTLFGSHPVRVNATKSFIGHCIGAAGVIEAVATLLQINGRFAHPTLNLRHPICREIAFVGPVAEPLAARYALSNAFGFGGFNSSIVLEQAAP